MATRSSWIDSWRRAVLGPNYAQWCSHHQVPESPDPLSIVTTSDLWPDSRIEGIPEYKNHKDNRIQSSEHRAPTSTWEADLKKIELFLMDWKAERNSQFDEIRESLRPNPASADSAEPCVLGDSREISSCKFGRYTMGLEVGGEVSAAQSGPFHSEIPKSQSTVVNETPKLQSVVANSTNVNSSLGGIFESQEWGGSIAEDSDCESREVNLTPSNVWTDSQIESIATRGSELNFFPCENPELSQTVVEEDSTEVDSAGLVEDQVQDDIPWDSKLGLDDRRALSPSTAQQKSDFRRGISTFPQTEFLDFDGMQLRWVRSVDGFDGIIEWVADSVETIELNLVDSMEFLETPSARKVFVEMPSRIVMLTALVDEKITNENGMEFLALQLPYDRGKLKHRMVAGIAVFDPGIDDRHECISWDFAIFVVVYIEVEIAVDRRNWVFDPGKGIELSLHIEMVETLGFLVSDPSGGLFSLKCAEYGFPQGMGKVVCCY